MRRVAVIDGVAIGAVLGLAIGLLTPDARTVPGATAVAACVVALLVLAAGARAGGRQGWLALACCVGVAIGGIDRLTTSRHLLGTCGDGVTATFVGRVSGLPEIATGISRFDFDTERVAAVAGCTAPGPRRLRLSWYEGPAVQPGDRWVLEVRLRALRSYRNPGGFDYVAWAQQRGIDAAGTVRRGLRLDAEGWYARLPAVLARDAWRDAISRWIDGHDLARADLVRALAVGDARALDAATWEVFRSTGTIHLLVISGLHVGIASAFGLLVGRGVARCSRALLFRVGDHPSGAIGAVLAALAYSALADFALPVARACLMALVAVGWWVWGRRLPPHRALLMALAMITGLDPSALVDGSLWLSAGAVTVLLAYFAYRRGLPWSSGWIRAQWVLFLAMVPIFTSTIEQFAWVAPLSNLVAVPLVSVLMVPLVLCSLLAGALVPALAAALLGLADQLASVLMTWLRSIDDAPVTHLAAADPIVVGLAAIAAVGVLLPLRGRSRLLLSPVVGCVFLQVPASVPWGEVQATVLDVGQGLAVLADTANHRLLYDTGPAYPSGFDLGAAVVVPALRATGSTVVDLVILSHGDLDHRGGFGSVERLATVETVVSGIPGVGGACRRGQSWQWDGVIFRVLHPDPGSHSDNDGSCVLAIAGRSGRALLPGDISRDIERTLARSARSIDVDLIVAPHHGSRTSSSPALVVAASARVVAVSAGHGNRFGHPHSDVVDRYRRAGARVATTAQGGALTWRSDDAGRFRVFVDRGRQEPQRDGIRGDE